MSTDPLTEARTVILNLTNKPTKEHSNLTVDDDQGLFTLNLQTPIDVPQIARPMIGLLNANVTNSFENVGLQFKNTKFKLHAGFMRVYDPSKRSNVGFNGSNQNGAQFFGDVCDYCEFENGKANKPTFVPQPANNFDYPEDLEISIPDGNYILSDIELAINKAIARNTTKTNKGSFLHYFDVAAKSIGGQQFGARTELQVPFAAPVTTHFVEDNSADNKVLGAGQQWYQACLGVANPFLSDEYGTAGSDIPDPPLTFEELQRLCDPDMQKQDPVHKHIPRLYKRHIKAINLKYNIIKNRIEIITLGNTSVIIEGTQDLADPTKTATTKYESTLADKVLGFTTAELASTAPGEAGVSVMWTLGAGTQMTPGDEGGIPDVAQAGQAPNGTQTAMPRAPGVGLDRFVGYRWAATKDGQTWTGRIVRHGVRHFYTERESDSQLKDFPTGAGVNFALRNPDGSAAPEKFNWFTGTCVGKQVPRYDNLAKPIDNLRFNGYEGENTPTYYRLSLDHVAYMVPSVLMGSNADGSNNAEPSGDTVNLANYFGATARQNGHEAGGGRSYRVERSSDDLLYEVTSTFEDIAYQRIIPRNLMTQTITAKNVGSIQQVRSIYVNMPGMVEASYDHNGEKTAAQIGTIPITVAPGAVESYQVDAPMFVPCIQDSVIDSVSFNLLDQDDNVLDLQGGRIELTVVLKWDSWSGDPLSLAPTNMARSLAYQQDLTAAQGTVPAQPRRPLGT